jgi:transcriptional regulator with XRE-family HTH domain
MAKSYWWSRYGNFDPGEGVLPHMGQVIAHYRKKYGCKTQADFAIAAGVKERTIIDWECSSMIADQNRRTFLARMLKIPPALLGLDWRLIYYQDNQGTQSASIPPEHLVELLKEESFYHYEDFLALATGWLYSGKLMSIADRVERRLCKLEEAVARVPAMEKEAWLGLLAQYYRLATEIPRHSGTDEANKRRCLRLNAKAIKIAGEIEDQELQIQLLLTRSDIHLEQEHTTQTRTIAHQTLQMAKQISSRTPLYGNVQLRLAPVLLPEAIADSEQMKSIWRSLDKVLNMVWDKKIEPDRSLTTLTLAGVHHERAKTFLELYKLSPKQDYLRDATNEMQMAWDGFSSDFASWALYFHLTEARLYEAQHEIEQSARSAIEALKAARTMNSKRKEDAIMALYRELHQLDARNPYVCNLGVQLGMF